MAKHVNVCLDSIKYLIKSAFHVIKAVLNVQDQKLVNAYRVGKKIPSLSMVYAKFRSHALDISFTHQLKMFVRNAHLNAMFVCHKMNVSSVGKDLNLLLREHQQFARINVEMEEDIKQLAMMETSITVMDAIQIVKFSQDGNAQSLELAKRLNARRW